MSDFEVHKPGIAAMLRAYRLAMPHMHCPRRRDVNGAIVVCDAATCTKAGKCDCGAAEALNDETCHA